MFLEKENTDSDETKVFKPIVNTYNPQQVRLIKEASEKVKKANDQLNKKPKTKTKNILIFGSIAVIITATIIFKFNYNKK